MQHVVVELIGALTHAAIIISRDKELTERNQVEKALREGEIELKKLLRLRDEFIANTSHELHTPLTSIMLYSEMLEYHFKEIASSRHIKMMHKLRFQVNRLHTLVIC